MPLQLALAGEHLLAVGAGVAAAAVHRLVLPQGGEAAELAAAVAAPPAARRLLRPVWPGQRRPPAPLRAGAGVLAGVPQLQVLAQFTEVGEASAAEVAA